MSFPAFVAQKPFSRMSSSELLPLDLLITGLQDVHQETFGLSLSPRVCSSVEQCSTTSMEGQESQWAEELLCFARSNPKLIRVTGPSVVPNCVPPPWCSAVLYDIKINGKGPDDKIYRSNEKIRTMIPRGVTVLEWTNGNTGDEWSSVVVYGNKKFTGGIGDEDDYQPEDNNVWRYFIRDPDTTKKIVCMEKVNGEAAHVAGRYIDGDFYLITGSKNVHLMIRKKSDIDLYTEPRYEFAKVIAATVWDTLVSLDERRRRLLMGLLHHTRCTLVGEILQPKNQHIVNLSHMVKPEVCFLSMTPTYTGHKMDTLIAIPPHHLLDLCYALGLRTTLYSVVDATKIIIRKEEIRRKKNTEGEVLYFLDEEENTIGLVKIKTTWYIVLRALREKAASTFTTTMKKNGSYWSLETWINATHRRLFEIQEWLKFPDSYLGKWLNLTEEFLTWLDNEIQIDTEKPETIRPLFPVVWNKFLMTTNQTDQIDL